MIFQRLHQKSKTLELSKEIRAGTILPESGRIVMWPATFRFRSFVLQSFYLYLLPSNDFKNNNPILLESCTLLRFQLQRQTQNEIPKIFPNPTRVQSFSPLGDL